MDHIPVLLQETIDGLNLKKGLTVVDATLGLGGHARAMGEKIGATGYLIGLDADRCNLVLAERNLETLACRQSLIMANFRALAMVLEEEKINRGEVDRFLFDLGLNSLQLESSGRGFSFQTDEPLLMTLANAPGEEAITAEMIINDWSEASLEAVLRGFGGEQFSGRIARVIVESRRQKKIHTTFELIAAIEKAVPGFYKHRRIHFATKTFQALRIAVNDEFGALEVALGAAWEFLAEGGRIAVVAFHEGEDRIVKNTFQELRKNGGLIITKKVIAPTRTEVEKNPRARSAKLRIIEKRKK